jgi:tRNA 2-selenouridine synthase
MLRAPAVLLDIPFEVRLQNIIKEYGNHDKEKLSNAIIRIQKRLGGLDTKLALQFLEEENIQACFEILLTYYDRQYKLASAISNRKSISLSCPTLDPEINMNAILNLTAN